MPGCIFCPLYYILFWQFSHKLCIDENHDLISSGVSWFKALWKCCLLCKFVLILCSIWPGTKEAPLGQEVLVCRSENATPHLGGYMARTPLGMHGTPWGIYGIPTWHMDTWHTLGIQGKIWGTHGTQWGIHGISWGIHHTPWGIYHTPWGIHRSSCKIHGTSIGDPWHV